MTFVPSRRVVLASATGLLATFGTHALAAPDTSHVVDASSDCGFRADAPGKVFSRGVAARPGFEFWRVRLLGRPPLASGLQTAAEFIRKAKRPLTALAAMELRLPKPLPAAEFAALNVEYVKALVAAGFVVPGETRPEARSNMAPLYNAPDVFSLHAFTFAVPAPPGMQAASPDYVISGKPESTDAGGVIGGSDYSAPAMRVKASSILDWLTDRITELGGDPAHATAFQIYTALSLDSIVADPFARSPLSRAEVTLIPGNPPVTGFQVEFDVRSVTREYAI